MRRFFLLLLVSASVLADARAEVRVSHDTIAAPLRPFVELLEDASGRLTISDVERKEVAERFRPVPGLTDLNLGYTESAFWLRLTVLPDADVAPHWLLEVAYPSLDRLDLFVRQGSDLKQQSAGDLQAHSARPFSHRNLVFPVALTPGIAQTIYLRVSSEGSLTLPVTLWSPAALHAQDQGEYTILSIYFGMLLALGLYNLLLYFSLREPIYLTYVACVAWMSVGQSSMFGLANQFLWPDSPAWGNVALPVGFCLSGFFGALFTRQFLSTKKTMPVLDRLLQLLQICFVLAALVASFYAYRPGGIATALIGTAFSVTAVFSGLLALKRRQPGALLFLAGWSMLLLGVALLGLRTLNWLPTNLLTSHGMQIGSALEMLLFSFALANRIQSIRRASALVQAEMLLTERRARESLEASEKLLEKRIAERTRELAESNDRLRQQELVLQDMALHDTLTGLANRSLLSMQLTKASARGNRDGKGFAVLMMDLDGFKPVNDNYGHAIGDQLLVEVARRLEANVRASDTVARVGGDEFVLVVEVVSDETTAMRIAEKALLALSRPMQIDNHRITVGASIGIALWPSSTGDVDELMQLADEAMYAAKRSGSGQCRIAISGVSSIVPSEK